MEIKLSAIDHPCGVKAVFDREVLGCLGVLGPLCRGKEVRLVLVVDQRREGFMFRVAGRNKPNAAVLRLRADGRAEAAFFNYLEKVRRPRS